MFFFSAVIEDSSHGCCDGCSSHVRDHSTKLRACNWRGSLVANLLFRKQNRFIEYSVNRNKSNFHRDELFIALSWFESQEYN